MINTRRKKPFLISVLSMSMLLVLTACGPSTGTPTPAELEAVEVISADTIVDRYVATDGDDTNSCATPDEPCLTVAAAYRKSLPYDRIHVAAGTYLEPGVTGSLLHIGNNITVIGAGSETTILDAGGDVGGIFIYGGTTIRLEGFTIQNTSRASASGCIEVRSEAEVTVEDVILQNCWRSGFTHSGSSIVRLIDVIIRNTIDEYPDPDFILNGYGIANSGEMIIEGGEIYGNDASGINNTGQLEVTNTVVRDNNSNGITHTGTLLLLDDVTVSGNGIFNRQRTGIVAIGTGRVRITDSTITANLQSGIFLGGSQELTISATTINNHEGAALNLHAGTSTNLTETIIDNNGLGIRTGTISDRSPGIYNGGNLTLTRSQVTRNGNGGVNNAANGRVYIRESEITHNRGYVPAVYNQDATSLLSISQSLIANNIIDDGRAAVESHGEAHIFTSTISNNSGLGVGAFNNNTTISYTTVAENGGAGINPGGYTIDNSLLANNAGGNCRYPFGSVSGILTGINIDTDGSCGFPRTYTPAELLLGPLADNGGPTRTHALAMTSPAVDAATGRCLPFDQRGADRPFGTSCDVGAYEFNPIFGATTTSLEDEDLVLATVTPPAQTGFQPPLVTLDSLCWTGPGNQYGVVSSVKQGAEVELLGVGDLDGWLVVNNPLYFVPCWLPDDNLELDPSLDLSTFKVFPVPPLPTPTITQSQPTATFTPVPQPVGPNAPSSLAANETACDTNNGYVIKLTWKDNANNEDGYRVYRDGGLLATLGANATQYTDNPPGSGPYSYYVQAFNNAGTANSNTAQEDGCIY